MLDFKLYDLENRRNLENIAKSLSAYINKDINHCIKCYKTDKSAINLNYNNITNEIAGELWLGV